jgi:hypothetical protein
VRVHFRRGTLNFQCAFTQYSAQVLREMVNPDEMEEDAANHDILGNGVIGSQS